MRALFFASPKALTGDIRKMHRYKLSPKSSGRSDPNWKLSTYCGEYEVLADSESQARLAAAREFGIAAKQIQLGNTLIDPWSQPNLVDCVCVE
jgi:hypothetical protein